MNRLTRRLAFALVLLAIGSAPLFAQLQPKTMTKQEQANLKLALDWWHDVVQGKKPDSASKYMPDTFISRNPNVETGRDAFVKAITATPQFFQSRSASTPSVMFAKGDYVALIWELEDKDPTAPGKTYKYNTLDLVRVQNGKIVEHWDTIAKLGKTPTYAKPDAVYPKSFTQSAAEEKTLDVGMKEFKDMLQYGHVADLAPLYMAPGYIQHNPNVPGGRDGFIKNFSSRTPEPIKPEWKTPPTMTLVSGNFVLFFGRRDVKDPADDSKTYPMYRFDMVRVDENLIQEHWDVAKKTASPPPAPPLP
jgi:predicted SnoaL-like aldol condensation-catalyzing enzyme